MKKFLTITTVLCALIATHGNAQIKDGDAGSKQSGAGHRGKSSSGDQSQSGAASNVPRKDAQADPTKDRVHHASLSDSVNDTRENAGTERQLVRATYIIGGLQSLALLGQAFLFFRQTKIMEQHKTSLEHLAKAATDNATAASSNAEFSKLNAEATRDTALALKQSVEMYISKERARIRIELNRFEPNEPCPGISYKVRLYGPTSAFIVDSKHSVYVSSSEEP